MADAPKAPTKFAAFGWRALIAAALVALGGLLSQIGRTMLEDEAAAPAPTPPVEPVPASSSPGKAPPTETD